MAKHRGGTPARRRALSALLCAAWLAGAGTAAACETTRPLDLGAHRPGIGAPPAAFVARDLATGTCHVSDAAATARRHAPWSTFKIPHLLIALEEGAVGSLDHRIRWDPERRPRAGHWPASWARDQTLASAFKNSVPWYFQELVPGVGAERYRQWLEDLGYGNARVPAGDDAFWLGGPLAISPAEQVAFLARLLGGETAVSAPALAALDAVSRLAVRDGFRLHGKTGSGPRVPGELGGAFEGWLVGYVRRPGSAGAVVFALYLEAESYTAVDDLRDGLVRDLLATIGAWPR